MNQFSIREAPWFQVDLPDYLFPRSGSLDVEVVDEQVVAEVCKVHIVCSNLKKSHYAF